MELDVVIGNPRGLHAELATHLSALVERSGAPVSICIASAPEYRVDASQLMSLLSLGAGAGETLTITSDGRHAERTLAAMAALLSDPG